MSKTGSFRQALRGLAALFILVACWEWGLAIES